MPPDAAALSVRGERRRAAVQIGDWGRWKGALPGMGCLVPGIGRDPGEGRGFQHFRRRFRSGDFNVFRVPCFEFPF